MFAFSFVGHEGIPINDPKYVKMMAYYPVISKNGDWNL